MFNPYSPADVGIGPDDLDDAAPASAAPCPTCRGARSVVCRDGSEVRCLRCDGEGWVPGPVEAPPALAA